MYFAQRNSDSVTQSLFVWTSLPSLVGLCKETINFNHSLFQLPYTDSYILYPNTTQTEFKIHICKTKYLNEKGRISMERAGLTRQTPLEGFTISNEGGVCSHEKVNAINNIKA